MTYQTLLYDHKALSKSPLGLDKYNNLFSRVKQQLNHNKIIYEKSPIPIDSQLVIQRDRLITETHDKLLIFGVGNPNMISVLWHKIYNRYKHVSIFNGKAIILNEPIGLHEIEIKHYSNNLFSAVFCDFQHYNIKKFTEQHGQSSNLTSNYTII